MSWLTYQEWAKRRAALTEPLYEWSDRDRFRLSVHFEHDLDPDYEGPTRQSRFVGDGYDITITTAPNETRP